MLASHLALQLWRSRKKPAAVSALRVGARVLRQRQLSTARRRTAGALLCSRTNHQQQLAPAAPSFSGFSTHALGDKTADDDGNDPQHDYPNPLERVCVVGTGPAGFYFARYLLREHPTVQVDMIDALPNPYGLVRSGVAPDHPEVKSVENDFDTTARVDSAGRLTFLGNVMVGKDVQLDELRRMYNAVVLAYGAQSDRSMGIPGENLQNSLAARPFVNWYNGHPDYTDVVTADMLSHDTAVIVGQGNVALDCARILCKDPDELAHTDIAAHALAALRQSKIRRVVMVGRRGHVQGAFTMKELRELTKLPSADFIVTEQELEMGLTPASQEEVKTLRVPGRIHKLLQKQAQNTSSVSDAKPRRLELRFLLSPTEVVATEDGRTVAGVQFQRNRLEGEAGFQRAVAVTGSDNEANSPTQEIIDCGLVLSSIGYRSEPVPGAPFDERSGTIPNDHGKVLGDDTAGLYVAGWLKRGPSGIIGTNINDAKETLQTLLHDAKLGNIPEISGVDGASGADAVRQAVCKARGTDSSIGLVVDGWDQWCKIDVAERAAGAAVGKPREKIVSVQTMLRVATE